jgi:biopolymer transport protein ExbD
MMVVAPTFQTMDNTISIPEVNSGTAIEQGKVTVAVTKDGTIYVDGNKISMGLLTDELERLKTDDEKAEVVVKADEKVKSSIIMEIMDAAQDAHYKKLIVAGEPLNKKEQRELEQAFESSEVQNTLDGASTSIPQDGYENWNE